MSTLHADILTQLGAVTKQLGDHRKLIDQIASGRNTLPTQGRVEKALGNAIGKAWSVDRQGNRYDATAGIDPRRAKSLGEEYGKFLFNVAVASDHNLQQRYGMSGATVMKSLEGMGAQPITKTPLAEGTGATGGYTVPPQFVSELLMIAAEQSFLRNLCRAIPMTSRNIMVPTLDQSKTPPTGGSAYYGGLVWTWQPEGSNYQTNAETEPTFRQVELVARDLVGIVIASNQLLQDNAVTLETILTTIFTEAMGWAYDYFILQGNGAAQPLGMLNAACAISVTKVDSAHVRLQDLANMLSRMLPSSYKNCIWALHPSVLPDLIAMTTSASTTPNAFLTWLNPQYNGTDGGPMASQIPGTILGRPFYLTEKLPKLAASATGSIALVDPTKYLVGDRMAIQVEASPYPNFVKNQMTWRIIARWDGQPELNAAITLADGTYTVSPIVLLNT